MPLGDHCAFLTFSALLIGRLGCAAFIGLQFHAASSSLSHLGCSLYYDDSTESTTTATNITSCSDPNLFVGDWFQIYILLHWFHSPRFAGSMTLKAVNSDSFPTRAVLSDSAQLDLARCRFNSSIFTNHVRLPSCMPWTRYPTEVYIRLYRYECDYFYVCLHL